MSGGTVTLVRGEIGMDDNGNTEGDDGDNDDDDDDAGGRYKDILFTRT